MCWRRLLLFAGVVAVLGAAGLLLPQLPWLDATGGTRVRARIAQEPLKPGVTTDNFRRIQVGMREDEVEAILGGSGKPWPTSGLDVYERRFWVGDDSAVFVGFLRGKVAYAHMQTRDGTVVAKLTDRE
jgi:hypothetical protein